MRTKFLLGTATAVFSLVLAPHAGLAAATMDDVMKRLDAIEKSNAQLAKENSELREKMKHVSRKEVVIREVVPAAAPQDPSKFKGNPINHAAIATSPGGESAPFLAIGGYPLISKDGPMGSIVDNTTVTLYGHGDVSVLGFDNGVYDQYGWKPAVASNGSYFGIRARHNLSPYGFEGWNFLLQFESLVDVSATPSQRASLGSRDSFVGIEGPYGAIKIGKSDSPYKRSSAAFDPFANTIGDYNSIVGNTGGDNRAEFDYRLAHAIWYESPIISGFQFSTLFSPGQNYAADNSDSAYGEFNCTGTTPFGSGSGTFDNTISTGGIFGFNQQCSDGSYGNAYSTALVYKGEALTAIAGFELHQGVNRHGDDGLETPVPGPQFNTGEPSPAVTQQLFLPNGEAIVTGVHDEWAAKVGAGYKLQDPWGNLQLYALGEMIRRVGAPALFNERSDEDIYFSGTQYFDSHWSFSAAYTHLFPSPGSSGLANSNNFSTLPLIQLNQHDRSANQYSAGVRYRFNQWASIYMVGSILQNAGGEHNCLGASGLGYQICGRDQFDNFIAGQTIKGVSSGFTFDF
jgi:predicted porin